MSYAMSQIRNFRRCGAGVPRALEVEAVIEEITAGWDLQAVCATAVKGVADADCEDIREMIRAEGLTLSPEEAARALHKWCRTRLRDLIEDAETQVRLDEVVSAYLEALGEADRANGEAYEETAARLNDDLMRAAVARWWELEEAAAEAAAEE